MAQNALSVVTAIKDNQAENLEKFLETIGNDLEKNPYVRFSEITSVHFACWVVLARDPNFPPCLVFESNFDGDLDGHLNELVSKAGSGLAEIYSYCKNFPIEAKSDARLLKQYLLDHRVIDAAFYVGCYGQSRARIEESLAIRESIEGYLDGEQLRGGLQDLTPTQIYHKIKEHLKRNPIPSTANDPNSIPYSSVLAKSRSGWFITILSALLLSPFLLLFLLVYVPVLRANELKDDKTPGPTPPSVDPRLFGKEDIWDMNHLTTLTTVKQGKFRIATLKGVLWLINLLAKLIFITGSLGGIPTIHFARWLLIDNDRRLLFFSNYDGSWASYLGDFVDKANYGLTAVWSNTYNFPSTQFLFFGGAMHIEQFKAWSRYSNEFAAVWYSAYPHASVRNITQCVKMRETLNGTPTDQEIAEFIQSL